MAVASSSPAPRLRMQGTSRDSEVMSGRKLSGLLGWTAVVGSIAYFASDALEAAHGGFTDRQLWLTLSAEAAVPFVVVGLYAVQRPAIGALGQWSALVYSYVFVFFTGTVVYAIVNHTPDFEHLTRDLNPWMTLHGVAVVIAGIAFGAATTRAGVLPRWTGVAFGTGVLLVALTVGMTPVVELTAMGARDVAIFGMGAAVLRTRISP